MSEIQLPDGVELPHSVADQDDGFNQNDAINDHQNRTEDYETQGGPVGGQPDVTAIAYTKDSKKVAFIPGQWEMDGAFITGLTGENTVTMVPLANVSRIVLIKS